jgi:hypothetical protein
MRLFVTLALLVASAHPALAGMCDEGNAVDELRDLERYAKHPDGQRPSFWHLCIDQIIATQPKLTERFLAACEKVLETDHKLGECVQWPITFGKKQLGKTDLFDIIEEAFTMDPLGWESQPALLYIKLDDPRAVPRFVAAWKAQAAKKPPRASWQQQGWDRFRGGAARFLGKHGAADEKAFLSEQLAAIHDPALAGTIRKAIAAIDARLAAPSSPSSTGAVKPAPAPAAPARP